MKFTKIFLFTLLAIFSLSFITNTTNVAQAGSSSGSVTVTVTPAPVVNPPTATLTADSYSLPYNGSTILHILGTNASYCILSWPGGSNTQGLSWNYTTPALIATTIYTLACGNTKADEVSDSKTITVASKPITYTVSTLASPIAGGSISPTSAIVDEGKTTSFTVTPNAGYSISGVTGCNGTGTSSYTTGAINADCKVTASFSPNSCPAPTTQIVKVACDVNANGDAATSGQVTRSQTKTAPSCTFGTPVDNTNSTYVSDTCKYPTKQSTFTITASAGSGGSISPSGVTSYTYPNNSKFYTITANNGYTTKEILVDGVSEPLVGGYAFYNIIADHTISASFSPNSCPAPTTQIVKVACDVNANGDAATSGQVTRSQTKTAPSCTFGTPVDNTNSTYVSDTCKYPTQVCTNGAINYSLCTIDKNNKCLNGATNPPTCTTFDPSGTLSATSCIIAQNKSTCVSKATWTTSNLIPGKITEVTRNNPSNTSISTATIGTNIPSTINYGNSTFYLYHNGAEPPLATAPVTATCDAQNKNYWDSQNNICILSGSNGETCTDKIKNQNETGIDIGGVCGLGPNPNPGPNPGPGPLPPPPLPLPNITSFNIVSNGKSALSPNTIRYNTRVNIDWTSADAASCSCTSADKKGVAGATCGDTVNNNPGSFQTLPLKKSMIFTLSCLNGNGVSTSDSKTVTVDDINTIYKEN
ncbi:MAG: hypothetical protein WC241_02210 [Candidatus Paceibacterota bacterium]|jgi:hypothetical protein